MTLAEIHYLGDKPNDKNVERSLRRIQELKSVRSPIICLPDIHFKSSLDAPTSISVATRGTVVRSITTSSPGCAIGILKTSLTKGDVTEKFLEEFYERINRDLVYPRRSRFRDLLIWLGLIDIPHTRYDFSLAELKDIVERGAEAAVKKYELGNEFLTEKENHGNVMDADEYANFGFNSLVPRSALRFGMHNIGDSLKGNHFIEIQYVEEIADTEMARRWGLEKGQVLIMYHGGDGIFAATVGKYFANRERWSWKKWLAEGPSKLLFHFGSLEGVKNIRARWNYYFRHIPFQEVPADTREGKRLFLSFSVALNHSYAFRLATVRRIMDSMNGCYPGRTISFSPLWEGVHTSVTKERIAGEDLIVHRSGTTRVTPGKPVIISGHSTASSYIGLGLPEAEKYLFSADHGAGETIKRYKKERGEKPHPKRYETKMFTRKGGCEVVAHIENDGLDYLINHLEREHIVSPVALVRPLAVLK